MVFFWTEISRCGVLGLFTFLPQCKVHNLRISELGVPVYSSLLDIRLGMWIYDTGTVYLIPGVDICHMNNVLDTRGGYMPGVQYTGYKGWIYVTGTIYWIPWVDICMGHSIMDTRCRGMTQVQYNGY